MSHWNTDKAPNWKSGFQQLGLLTAIILLLLTGVWGCTPHADKFDPGQIVATEVISPGRPMAEFNRPTIVREGAGEPLQVGDFVTMHYFRMDKQTGKIIKDQSVGWAWLGFLYQKQTPFYTCETENLSCEVDSAMVGMKVGTVFKYDHVDWTGRVGPMDKKGVPGGGGAIPIGRIDNYRRMTISQTLALRKSVHTLPGYLQAQLTNIESSIFRGPDNDIDLPKKSIWWPYGGGGTEMVVGQSLRKIVQRCPAQLLRHTREVVRTGPMLYGEGWIPTQITREPRRLWVSEVELLGKCADGSTMSFKLGPMGGRRPPDRPKSGPTYQGYWDDWFKQAGDHLPLAIHITPAPDIPIPHDCPPEGCAVP